MDGKNTILIIEDDAGLSELLTEKIEEGGYLVACAYTGKDALKWLDKNTPFLIILDYSLPDMDGLEFIAELVKFDKAIPPFIVSTGQGDERIAVEMMKLGARDYIIKDNHFLDLIPIIVIKAEKEIKNENRLAKTEEALLESTQFSNQIIQSAQEGIIVYDLDLKIKVWNPFMERFTGISEMEVIGVEPNNTLPFLTEPGIVSAFAKAFNGETSREVDFLYNNPSHTKLGWVSNTIAPLRSSSGRIIGAICTVRDITDRKIAEVKLKESEEKYRRMIEHSNDLVWTVDVDGNLTFMNETTEKTTGLKQADLIGKSFKLRLLPEDISIWTNSIESNLNGDNCYYDLRFKRSDATILTIAVNSAPIYTNGNIEGVVSFGRDITEKKFAEQELIIAKERAEESSRLKTAFLNNVSHEFRTPMNAIMGFSQFLINDIDDKSQREMFVGIIQNACNQLLDIVTDVVEISEIQSNQISLIAKEINLQTLLEGVKSLNEKEALDKNLDFVVDCNIDESLFNTFADTYKLTKTLKHLVTNAIKFTYKGGVKVECHLINANEYEFTVCDSGIGITEGMQEKIFEPFRQVETSITRNFGGPGVGLSIAKAYIEVMGGKISLQSEINKGTTIKFTMPYKPTDKKTTKLNKNNLELKLTNKTILIAEDELSNFVLIKEFLAGTNARLLHAKNGVEAIDFCRNNAQIDLVLMDIKMPILDGYTAAKQIKIFRPDIVIVAQTAYAQENERRHFDGIAFNDYITKPINISDFQEMVSKQIENR